MGLLPIIFTALTIFTICIVAIFSISYIIYKLKTPRKHRASQQIPAESFSFATETVLPSYNFIQEFEEPILVPEQRYFRQTPKPRNINRYEILNGYRSTPSYQNENKYFNSLPLNRNSHDIFSNYSNYNSIDFKAVRLQK